MLVKKPTRLAINMDIKNSMALLLHPDPSQQQQSQRNNHIRLIKLPTQYIQRQLDIFTWRYKTSLPFIKPIQYSLNQISRSSSNYQLIASQLPYQQMHKKSPQKQKQGFPERQGVSSLPPKEEYELLVKIEEIICRLSDVGMLPFSQILYLLKEMMIGYDVLIDKFGTFSPSEGMVAVNQGCQWRVWINEDFTKNTRSQDAVEIGERQFIYRLILFAEKHCTSTLLSKTFFGEVKQFTYSKECDFIKILEKIKEFVFQNKIFQVNKVSFPGSRLDKSQKSELNLSTSINEYRNNPANSRYQLNIQKKSSLQYQSILIGVQSPTNPVMSKSYFNPIVGSNKTSQFVPTKQMQNNSLNQSQSQKVFNKSSFFYHPPQAQSPTYQPIYLHTAKMNQNLNRSSQFRNNPFPQQQPIRTNAFSGHSQKPFINSFKSPQNFPKPQSPPPQLNLSKNTSSFSYLTKSRHELKNLLGKKEESPEKQKSPEKLKPNKPQRKYSEQIFKAKSVDALASGLKKIHGSNIYEQDPEIKYNGVNINVHHVINNSPSKNNNVTPNFSKTNEKSSALKGAGCSTPNNSSNSTQQVQKSRDKIGGNQSSYEYLKVNDLNSGKTRNNQSSCYGISNYQAEQKRQKNMAISCSFRNRDQKSSKSRSVDKQENMQGNQWTKKLSGLFSDDASIKQLKSSVKFKSGQQERFEKEFLKDVKLEMLQKFGRPVRHSIVDEEDDDLGPVPRNPYQSMQLIEQVVDDEVKSFMQKDEEVEEVDAPPIRSRNQTVQINYKENKVNAIQIEHRECVSYECSENSDDDEKEAFNFQSESYVINIK